MKRSLLYSLVSLVGRIHPVLRWHTFITSFSGPAVEVPSVKPKGTIRVVDLHNPAHSTIENYAGLVMLDKDYNYVPCLAEDWRWIDDRTIEFELRQGVTFHNGEKFDAHSVHVNWEHYKKMENPTTVRLQTLPDETLFQKNDDYTVRFTLPEPDGLAFVKFRSFYQIAPAFFIEHKFNENNWGRLPEGGPWETGPFQFIEGNSVYGKPGHEMVLEANKGYWDRSYPKVERVIFDNTLIGDRDEAMRLCRDKEGFVDIVNQIRPLDTLKVAESPFGKVVKSRDATALCGLFNQRRTGSKWRDIRLRKAINYAINREELWKYCAKGHAYNLGGFILPGVYGHSHDLTLYTYDTDKARALLAEAGYPNGFEVKIISNEPFKLEAQIISKMLERVGLKVRRNVLTHPEDFRKTYIPLLDKPPEEQDWDVSIRLWWDVFGDIGAMFLAFGFIDGTDFRWIEYDPVYEKMWKDMAMTVDIEAK